MNVTETGSSIIELDNNEFTSIRLTDILKGLLSDLSIKGSLAKYLSVRTRNEGLKFLCQVLPKVSSAFLQAIECGGVKTLITHPICCSVDLRSRRSPFRVLISSLFGADGTPNITTSAAYTLQCILQMCDYFKKLELENETKVNYVSAINFVRKNTSLENTPDFTATEICLARHISRRAFPSSYTSQHHFFHLADPGDGPGTYSRELPESTQDGKTPCAALKRGKRNNSFLKKHQQYKFAIMRAYPEGATFGHLNDMHSELLLVPKTATSARVIVREPKHNLRLQKSFFRVQSHYLNRITNGRLNLYSQTYNQLRAQAASINKDVATIDVSNGSNSVRYKDIRDIERGNADIENLLDHARTETVFIPINWESADDRDSGVSACYTREFSIQELEADGLIIVKRDGTSVYTGNDIWIASVLEYERGFKTKLRMPNKVYRKVLESRKLHNTLVSELDTLLGTNKRIIYGNRLGYVVKLHMLAGMGSYLTFCFMMRYFLTLLVMSAVKHLHDPNIIHRKSQRKKLNETIDSVLSEISIYGDDIECPSWLVKPFTEFASSRGVVLNLEKSFVSSHFRESCGPFYYNGVEVTPLRCSLPVQDDGDSLLIKHKETTLMALAAHSRLLKDAGFNSLARVYRRALYRSVGREHATGILEPGLTSRNEGVLYLPEKVNYSNMTDDDRWADYWSRDRYELTTYGASLLDQVKASDCINNIRLLGPRAHLIPSLYNYRPMVNPAIPKSGKFVVKNDDYDVILRIGEREAEAVPDYTGFLFWILCVALFGLVAGCC